MSANDLEPVKLATCHLALTNHNRTPLGTGYLIEPNLVATCEHVVRDPGSSGKVRVEFLDSSGANVREEQGTVEALDPITDCALVRLSRNRDDRAPLMLAAADSAVRADAPWLGCGYPGLAHGPAQPTRLRLDGTVNDPESTSLLSVRSLTLNCNQLGPGLGMGAHGMSGGPIVIGGEVVGHLCSIINQPAFDAIATMLEDSADSAAKEALTEFVNEFSYTALFAVTYASPVASLHQLLAGQRSKGAEPLAAHLQELEIAARKNPAAALLEFHARRQGPEISEARLLHELARTRHRQLLTAARPTRKRGLDQQQDRRTLVIQVKSLGGQLDYRYAESPHGDPIVVKREPRPQQPPIGSRQLCHWLFPGAGEVAGDCLDAVLHHYDPDAASPLDLPLRIRLETDDPELLDLPWDDTQFDGRSLRDQWSFEFLHPRTAQDSVELTLSQPIQVLGGAIDTDRSPASHCASIRTTIHGLLGSGSVARASALEPDAVVDADIVYCISAVRERGGLLELQSNAGDWIALDDCVKRWNTKVLILHLVGQPFALGKTPARLRTDTPLLVVLRSPTDDDRLRTDREAVIDWFATSLPASIGAAELDLEPFRRRGAAIWCSPARLMIANERKPGTIDEREPALLLDRIQQRNEVRAAIDELLAADRQHCAALIAYGDQANHPELFGSQADQFVVDYSLDTLHVLSHEVDGMQAPLITPGDLRAALLDLDDARPVDATLRNALAHIAPRRSGHRSRVLLLDWRCRENIDPDSLESLRTWLSFLRDDLAAHRVIPRGVKVLNILTLSVDRAHLPDLRAALEDLENDFTSATFSATIAEPLDDCRQTHIYRCVTQISRPVDSEAREFAKLVFRFTKGRFNKVVEWLVRVKHEGFSQVLDDLRRLADKLRANRRDGPVDEERGDDHES